MATLTMLLVAASLSRADPDALAPASIASMSAARCTRALDVAGISYTRMDTLPDAVRVAHRGPINGIAVEFVGRDRAHAEMDCRLVHAIAEWAPVLREASIVRLRHLSAFRSGAVNAQTGRTSGHASGMAVDVRYFDREDGTTWDVTTEWGERERGAPPCGTAQASEAESTPMRRLVCDAVRAHRFQVVVTPNRDDAHHDHVHLELVPNVPWTYAR